MLQPEEEEEFVVIKAGPTLPLRRPRPLKANTNAVSSFPKSNSSSPRSTSSANYECLTMCPPQPIVVPVSRIPSKVTPSQGPRTLSNLSSSTKSATPTPTPRRARSPSPSLTNRSRPQTPSSNVESKVKQYIETVKKFDEEQRCKSRMGKEKFLSLEDLYQVTTLEELKQEGPSQMEERLRESLRIIKEKDQVIQELRESCHELKLKYADAESVIDEMRFFGCSHQTQRYGSSSNNFDDTFSSISLPKRSMSDFNLKPMSKGTNTDVLVENKTGVDKATVTDKNNSESSVHSKKEIVDIINATDVKSRSQITTDADDDICDLELESGESNFDPVLEEKCSNWLEKVQNWKTDTLHNTSLEIRDKDSCGDRDSGFRGSAELEKPNSSKRILIDKSTKKSLSEKESNNTNQCKPNDADSTLLHRRVSIPTLAAHFTQKQELNALSTITLTQHFETSLTLTEGNNLKPEEEECPSLQFAQPWFTRAGNVKPQSATDYEGYPSYSSSLTKSLQNKKRSVSMDKLNSAFTSFGSGDAHLATKSQNDRRELIKSIDKRFKTLHPLIDSTTSIALRIKRKSENLAKILHESQSATGNSQDAITRRGRSNKHRQSIS